MKTTIELLKEAVREHGIAVDADSMFELLVTTCCCCCDACCGGNVDCKPDPEC
jgi:hypothetical protein